MNCSFGPCDQPANPKAAKGLCTFHYGQYRRQKPLSMTRIYIRHVKGQLCSVGGCDFPAKSKGFCGVHFSHAAAGKPLLPVKRKAKHEDKNCAVSNCDARRKTGKWCRIHYHYSVEFKLDPQLYEDMLIRQNGVCAICRKVCATGRRLAVDHSHDNGRIRGLLCSNCNRGIGLLGDNKDILIDAARYLDAADRAFDASIRQVA